MNYSPEAKLSATEIRDLGDIAGTMIPESAAFGVPGADDPAILADIVKSVGRDLPLLRQALAAIAAKSAGAFAGLDRDAREALINDYAASGGAAATATLGRVIVSAYYRDDRVLLALGLEARAPFPKGHTLEQGDWSLLDAVRKRAPFWRDGRTTTTGDH
ncbi:MAG TPA: hypothetical protein VK681_11665 [Reyranella sp.]|jgi:hypothetical protein|nr:hypothetical protein [Reyranella sp.]